MSEPINRKHIFANISTTMNAMLTKLAYMIAFTFVYMLLKTHYKLLCTNVKEFKCKYIDICDIYKSFNCSKSYLMDGYEIRRTYQRHFLLSYMWIACLQLSWFSRYLRFCEFHWSARYISKWLSYAPLHSYDASLITAGPPVSLKCM